MLVITRRLVLCLPVVLAACGQAPPSSPIVVDGSSTLSPLTQAVAADFMKSHRSMPVTVGAQGTVEGFTHFCRGEP
jgi:phosphate transport system substrate-binding protein